MPSPLSSIWASILLFQSWRGLKVMAPTRVLSAKARDACLRNAAVLGSGVIEIPGPVDFNFNFGFPDKTAYACMSETILMALEGTCEPYTLGRDLTVEQVTRIGDIAKKHGFKLAGFRSFEKALDDATIERVRKNAKQKR